MMDFYVDYRCEDNNETGRIKLSVSDFETATVRDVKYAIQAAIQAPVCDQQLFYQGQPVTDDDMTLSRLYFREGDCFNVQFLAVANITRMSELVGLLKSFAQEIVENLNRQLPVITTKEDHNSLRRLHDFFSVRHQIASLVIQELKDSFFSPWKCLRTVAQRHFFVQEGGFEAFLEVFKFSREIYHGLNESENTMGTNMIPNQHKHLFNECQLHLQSCCLEFLWDFGETRQDKKFLLSKDVFPLAVDALLLQSPVYEETNHINDIARKIVDINEAALGPFGELVECDPNIQEEVSKMSPLIDKLLFIIERCQSEPAGYSLFSGQVVSNILFYCTWNVKSAQPLVDCGALGKMLNITQKLLIQNKDGDAPLRYYSCLFLARLRSAPLMKLDRVTCAAIDELIDVFLEQNVSKEISKWEEDTSYIWVTMVPLVHLAFAGGKEYYWAQIKDFKCGTAQTEDAHFLKTEQANVAITESDETDAGKREETLFHQTSCKRKMNKSPVLSDTFETTEVEHTSLAGDKNCVTADKKDQFTWPGSPSTQKLGIFSLMHMLLRDDNQQVALAESLVPHLVCLSWHLKCDEKEKLKTILANFPGVSSPPSLKVVTKSVLALVNGLDMVYKL